MKKFEPEKMNNEKCDLHNEKYICYCFDCNLNICEKCLKVEIIFIMKKIILLKYSL